jgi:ribosome-binding factor A
MASQERAHRLADRIKVIVAECLEMRIKDPRLGFITVTDTRVTADLREATVFYTVFGDDAERAATAAALESANGILRTEVGKRTGIKFTPTLTFILDALPDSAKQVDDLLARAAAADAEVHARAVGATFAGDADPYRVPRIENADDEAES